MSLKLTYRNNEERFLTVANLLLQAIDSVEFSKEILYQLTDDKERLAGTLIALSEISGKLSTMPSFMQALAKNEAKKQPEEDRSIIVPHY